MTLWNSAMRCAQQGLLPDNREAALVPFKNRVQYLPMVGGLLKLFRNSGQFKWVTAGIVYEGEEYEHYISEGGEHFRHVPGDNIEGKKIRRVYALATTKDGGSFIADLPLSEINKRKAMSRATREDAPWKQWEREMQLKTAIRVLSKLLPMSSDIDALMQRDEAESLGVETAETISDQRGAAFGNVLDHFAGTTADQPSTEATPTVPPQSETMTEDMPK
jgi:recombination protein RecT